MINRFLHALCTVLVVLAIWHIMQHVKDEIAFLEASVSSGFNVEDLVIDLDIYTTGFTKVQSVNEFCAFCDIMYLTGFEACFHMLT